MSQAFGVLAESQPQQAVSSSLNKQRTSARCDSLATRRRCALLVDAGAWRFRIRLSHHQCFHGWREGARGHHECFQGSARKGTRGHHQCFQGRREGARGAITNVSTVGAGAKSRFDAYCFPKIMSYSSSA